MKRATFADAESAQAGADAATAQPQPQRARRRSCLKQNNSPLELDPTPKGPSANAAASLASLHHQHVHFLSNSGTSLGLPGQAAAPTNQHVVINLHKLLTGQQPEGDTLTFRSVPFGMLRARHTYSTRFAVVGGKGCTQVDGVAEAFSSQLSVCKEPASQATSSSSSSSSAKGKGEKEEEEEEEMFEVIFRPMSRGPFEGVFYLWIATDQRPTSPTMTLMHIDSHDMEATSTSSTLPAASSSSSSSSAASATSDAASGDHQGQGCRRRRLEVVITAQILRKGMGKPSLRDGVRCIAIDEEEDSDADSDGWAGF